MPSKTDQNARRQEILNDYKIGWTSRHASLVGRKEVLTGKAKFGIFGDGKELAQIALAKVFAKGDWRAGYYRDQTIMMALGLLTPQQFFAQLFADTNLDHDPHSSGRQMNNHFSTHYLDENGAWASQTSIFNSSSDISPTGGQMPRLVGLAYASKLYRQNKRLYDAKKFSLSGNEIAFGTIGNASTSEGLFWESINAAGVLQIPLLMSVWDDGYGISVPNIYQTTKASISEALRGFEATRQSKGLDIHVVNGWDYENLINTYKKAADRCRSEHVPTLVHVVELTQPQGHSTSGSHERYKTKDRLTYEETNDCLVKFGQWIIKEGIASESELRDIEQAARQEVEAARTKAWQDFLLPIEEDRDRLIALYEELSVDDENSLFQEAISELRSAPTLFRRTVHANARRMLYKISNNEAAQGKVAAFCDKFRSENFDRYSSHLYAGEATSPLSVDVVAPEYDEKSERVDGRQIIQKFFDLAIERDPRIFIVGEDIGQLGGVNLEFDGLQEKYGVLHVTDTGIREATILGQALGAGMRGLRPIADIQYLDYLLFCFQGMSDDLSTLRYRSAGRQASPTIVRTKGHRLEGVWHTGSPIGMIINGIRGMHVCVPRNMTQAAGMYNTLLKGDDPALVIEVLNGYRLKEKLPSNLGSYTVPLGVPEVIVSGTDITVLTYGACVKVAQDAVNLLSSLNISIEIIDVQTLLPFDRFHMIRSSIEKTNALVCFDEDVPGGASAYMLQQVLEKQQCYEWLDGPPRTLTAKAHRAPYASDGDYYSKPSVEDLVELCYAMMRERKPDQFPSIGIGQ